MTRSGEVFATVGAALAGATIGYVAGVLSAPQSGRDTRRALGRRLEHQADDLVRKAESTLKGAQERLSAAVHS